MKHLAYFLVVLSILMFSCTLPSTVTPTPPPLPSDTPVVSEPPVKTGAPTEPGPVIQAANVTCQGMSLYLDPALATNTTCEVVPESTMEMEVHPQYVKLTLVDYPLQNKFFPATLSIFPVQAYTALMPDYISGRVSELQALLSGGLPGTSSLPFLPTWNAAQTFHSNYSLFPFLNGGGIRFLTLYAQYAAPVNNQDLFYTYQGLTTDGQFWVAAILPINHVMLPETADPPPGGMTFDQFAANYETYIADMTSQLEAQLPNSFTPTLTALDALIYSISIQP